MGGRGKEEGPIQGRLAGPALHSNESAAMCWMAGLPRGRMAQVGVLGSKCQDPGYGLMAPEERTPTLFKGPQLGLLGTGAWLMVPWSSL